MEAGSSEERKEFVRTFVAGAKVMPDAAGLELRMRKLPDKALPRPQIPPVGW